MAKTTKNFDETLTLIKELASIPILAENLEQSLLWSMQCATALRSLVVAMRTLGETGALSEELQEVIASTTMDFVMDPTTEKMCREAAAAASDAIRTNVRIEMHDQLAERLTGTPKGDNQ